MQGMPGMSAMLHAVVALAQIDESTPTKRAKLLPVSCYGDVRNTQDHNGQPPFPLPLSEFLTVAWVVPNIELTSPASHILERYVEPAANELATKIMNHEHDSRAFARLALPPKELGAHSFRADHNDLSVLCSMSYSAKDMGILCQMCVLYGTYELG